MKQIKKFIFIMIAALAVSGCETTYNTAYNDKDIFGEVVINEEVSNQTEDTVLKDDKDEDVVFEDNNKIEDNEDNEDNEEVKEITPVEEVDEVEVIEEPKEVEEVEESPVVVNGSIYWDKDLAPNYYLVTGKANFNRKISNNLQYGKLDSYNRPTWASIVIDDNIIAREKQEERQDIKVDPIGWPNRNPKTVITHPDGSTYSGYLFNRSHMIADSLGGDAIYENLVTGTRPQNVGGRGNDGGMAYVESKVRNFFEDYKGENVKYLVENVYNKDELIPRITIVNVLSSNKVLNERVVIYNVANNIEFSYYDASVGAGLVQKAPKKEAKQNNTKKVKKQVEFNSIGSNDITSIDTNKNGIVTIKEAKEAGYKMPICDSHWLYEYMVDRDGDGCVGE